MTDIVLALALMAALTTATFALALRFCRRASRRAGTLLALVTLSGVFLYMWFLAGDVLLARVLPFSSLIILGNWFPPALGVLGGVAWDRVGGGLVRRAAYVAGLAAVAGASLVQPLWGQPPACQDRWEGDICIQTTDDSCSAACAATLLKAAGIEATEQEMAELCLTRKGGTTWQGLYRGLKLKTAGTGWDVEVFRGDLDALRDRTGPMILAAGVPKGADVDPIYTEQYGWTPGELHSVLFFSFAADERVEMGEPTPGVGREQWTVEDLRVLWRGRGIRLVER
jgi:hypothetical protein